MIAQEWTVRDELLCDSEGAETLAVYYELQATENLACNTFSIFRLTVIVVRSVTPTMPAGRHASRSQDHKLIVPPPLD